MSTLMAIAELRRLTTDELRRELRDARSDYAKLRMSIEMQSEKNHAKMKNLRRSIARMCMVLDETKGTAPKVSEKEKVTKETSQKPKKSVQRSRSASKKA